MYVSSLKINNYRKFGRNDNTIGFVEAKSNNAKHNIVASSTTLVIGKNNSGKTTVTKALELMVSDSEVINGHDFNYNYAKKILSRHFSGNYDETPKLKFEIEIIFDNSEGDFTGVLGAFVDIKTALMNENKKAKVTVEYKIKDMSSYHEKVEELISSRKGEDSDDHITFRRYLEIISALKFKRVITNNVGRVVDKVLPKNLIDLRVISSAKNIHDKKLLTRSFNKIIKFMYENNDVDYKNILGLVGSNNESLTLSIKNKHQTGVQSVLSKIISDKKIGLDLRSDLTFEKLMSDLVIYEHKDGAHMVPEGQFGLGYASLISILGEIIDYANQGLNKIKQSRIRILCIEEPEVFMHPQMQINFVRHIQEALLAIFELAEKSIDSIKTQLLVTTHSSHILNSIIHGSGTLDDINYIHLKNGDAASLLLKDDEISDTPIEKEQFTFIKKHIKHQVPELFFSDAIILVEGITEERVLNYYIESNTILSRMHISVFRIDGAHGKVYASLTSKLLIPTLIITDIDYCKDKSSIIENPLVDSGDNDESNQISEIKEGTITTNATLKHFFNSDIISNYHGYYQNNNVMVVFQKDSVSIRGGSDPISYYATSFEEAVILENYNNHLLHEVLNSVLGKSFRDILNNSTDGVVLAHNSSKIQNLLAKKKSDFSNLMIYLLVTKNTDKPELPAYIKAGLNWLAKELNNSGADDVFLP
ncbi:ATP-dependent endonuclease [Erwinia sp. Leaf53]|uniref:ATP-dependent nuclease n=1 Tax=Erwinia sp. Leaf53 TaxID=1736225 RepID=UPI0006FF9726|nr:AAA family ATPase [Erwinia sp. Leaf53]KQN64587.1 hypothetical protein ASF13_01545 [Erwinia sp. Leaf53]